ncbi:NAD(P)H-binding protein [Aeromicrobium sp. SMF47]|uniref:NAD(P)H-binding protein n=1 Tax=Aeromicrobium yanjiei TaxID=2662028 RepID=A0A5Q2MKH7_9ACTN|nr:SDR family oxidoreductase [Aeromicrobium yanjiei]MRJ76548.1 NAD(P)H-binding protein [Aeromicrobium yanjiei]QGG42289.1 NAD(P)H-binding protein [Aeromicrobium yanjiei]
MTIAVTAATGHLGSLVVSSLLDRVPAAEIVAVVRDRDKAQPFADRGVDVRVADYTDADSFDSALAGVDRLLLISGTDFGDRRAQHAGIIDAAAHNGVSLVAYTSAPAADTSTLPVAPDHLATEQYLAQSGIDHVLLRNGWYHENYLPTLETARQTGSVLTSAGDGRVSSAARADLAEAAAVVLTTDEPVKPVYELGGDVAWSQAELASTIGDVLGSPVSVAQVQPEEQAAILAGAGVPPFWADFAVSTDASIRDGELEVPGNELSTLIGRPTTPLAETLRAAV